MEQPERPDQDLRREVKELRSWGRFDGTIETATDRDGRIVEEISKDPDGTITSHTRFIRDDLGRLQEELWEERTDDGTMRKGKYVYVYDKAGNQTEKIWQSTEE